MGADEARKAVVVLPGPVGGAKCTGLRCSRVRAERTGRARRGPFMKRRHSWGTNLDLARGCMTMVSGELGRARWWGGVE